MAILTFEIASKVLVVEGYSDLRFYAECLQAVGRHGAVHIEEVKGASNLADRLEVLLTPLVLIEKTHIGIIVDADASATGGLSKSARNCLQAHRPDDSRTGRMDRQDTPTRNLCCGRGWWQGRG